MTVSNESAPSYVQAEGYPIYPAAMSSWEGERARYMDYRRTLGYQMYACTALWASHETIGRQAAVGGVVIFDRA